MSPSLRDMVKRHLVPGIVTPQYEVWQLRNQGNTLYPQSVADLIAAEMTKPQRDRTKAFSASGVHTCQRAQVFRHLGVEQGTITDSALLSIFDDGRWRHLRWQANLLTAGIIDTIEVGFVLRGGGKYSPWTIKGTLDGEGVDPEDGERFGLEIKGIRTLNWVEDSPKEEHLWQVATYFLGKPELARFSIIYDEKSTQDYKEFVVRREDVEDYSNAVISTLNEMGDAMRRGNLPPVLKGCQRGTGQEFRSCSFSGVCLEAGDVIVEPPKRVRLRKP